ncbi:MAG: hypothetical protein WB542_18140 [Polaromonas sp.]
MNSSARLREFALAIRGNLHNRDAVADGFELIADELEAQPAAEVKPAPPKAPAKKATAKKAA